MPKSCTDCCNQMDWYLCIFFKVHFEQRFFIYILHLITLVKLYYTVPGQAIFLGAVLEIARIKSSSRDQIQLRSFQAISPGSCQCLGYSFLPVLFQDLTRLMPGSGQLQARLGGSFQARARPWKGLRSFHSLAMLRLGFRQVHTKRWPGSRQSQSQVRLRGFQLGAFPGLRQAFSWSSPGLLLVFARPTPGLLAAYPPRLKDLPVLSSNACRSSYIIPPTAGG